MNEIKGQILNGIQSFGYKPLLEYVMPIVKKMVTGTKLKKELGVHLIAYGYTNFRPEAIRASMECLLEEMPKAGADPKEIGEVREIYDYYAANEVDILADHGIKVEGDTVAAP